MLRKRILFTLIYSHGFFMQSRNFMLQRVGDLRWLENEYNFQKIAFSLDELIVLNASRNNKEIENFAEVLGKLVNNVFIPIASGGGIRSMDDAELLFNNGADKIIVNSALFKNPSLIRRLAEKYGSQSIIASIDYKFKKGVREVYIHDGSKKIANDLMSYIAFVESLNVGEIYLNSIDHDGSGFGFDLKTIQEVARSITVPLIIAGGGDNENHLLKGLKYECVSAVAATNLFNYIGDGLPNARKLIADSGENIANWDVTD